MKKIFTLLLILMLGVLAACGGDDTSNDDTGGSDSDNGTDSGETSDGVQSVTAWAWDPNFNIRALELANQAYDGDSEMYVEIIENAQDDIIQRLNAGLSSGTTQGMPNIVLIEDYRAQSFLQSYPDAFYPLTDILTQMTSLSTKSKQQALMATFTVYHLIQG